MALTDMTQWSTIRPFISAFPAWAGAENGERLASYMLYEGMYWNEAGAFKLNQRGSDSNPIYIPAPRGVIETMNRYLAPGLTITCDPNVGTEDDRLEALALLAPLLDREMFYARFGSAKRFGLIRGNFAFHVFANPDLPEGSRLSIEEVDPGSLFPIYGEGMDSVRVIGWHIVDQIVNDDGDVIINRTTYRKTTGTGGPSPITVEEATFEADAWGGPGQDEKRIKIIRQPTALDARITSLPIYNFPNTDQAGAIWGSSELRGFERLFSAINQSISDEELELILNGLGVYVTDSGTPVDQDTGEELPWNLGPGRVVEIEQGKKFDRVDATKTVVPHQEHLKYLHNQLDENSGTPDIAKGSVDVQVAESGIALALQMAPIFSRAEEKELIITGKLKQMWFDIKVWLQVYEGQDLGEVTLIPTYGPRIPNDDQTDFDRLMALAALDPPIVSGAWIRRQLTKLGYEFPEATEMLEEIATERTVLAQIESDVTGARMDTELEGGDDGAEVPEGSAA